MDLSPYLNFNGTCEAAFKFYERVFGGTDLALTKNANSPMSDKLPPELRDKVFHAQLKIGERSIMGSDAPPQRYSKPAGSYTAVSVDSSAQAERIFKELSEKGNIEMPMQETFWAARFGMLVDQFGIPWMVNCDKHE